MRDMHWRLWILHDMLKEILPYQEEDRELKYEASTYDIDKNPSYIHRKYVKKDEWVGHTFWDSRTFSLGSGNGSGRIGWYGTSYFDVKMPKKQSILKLQ